MTNPEDRGTRGRRDIRDVARERGFLLLGTDPDPERERKIADEELSIELLAGMTTGPDRQAVTCYPEKNGRRECEGRKALARIIRDHVPGFAGELLALAIDPSTPSKVPGMTPTRHIQFESRAQGKQSQWARDMLVVHTIRHALFHSTSGKEDAACAEAEKAFGLSAAAVKKIWRRHKHMMAEESTKRAAQPETK